MGAFMSFTCGNFGTRGGIGLQIGQPGDQEVFIGYKEGDRFADSTLKCLPFYTAAVSRAADAFLVEQAGPAEQNVKPDAVPFKDSEFSRSYGWASDEWQAEGLRFSVYSPFGSIPDPASANKQTMREGLLPAVVARLVFDNTSGKTTRTAMFALNHARPGSRILEDKIGSSRVAFAFRREAGGAAELLDFTSNASGDKLDAAPFVFMRWSASDGVRERYNPVHLLGSCPGFGFEVPAGKKYGIVIAIGSYLEGFHTTGLDGRYLYTRYFDSLGDVLKAALDHSGKMIATADSLDSKLESSALSADQKFLISHATHSYYGSTQLLEIENEPFWVVNEGEYCMMNTLDLSIDHVFWELDHNPWLVRNLLDRFVRRYSYTDEVKIYKSEFAPSTGTMMVDPSATPPPPDEAQLNRPYETAPGGISFCHDMGAHNNFSPKGRSSYELANLTGCFSLHDARTALQLDSHRRLLHRENSRCRMAQEQQVDRRGLPRQHDQPRRRRRLLAVRQHALRRWPGNHHLRLARSLPRANPQQRLHRGQELGVLPCSRAHVPRSRRRRQPETLGTTRRQSRRSRCRSGR